MKRCFVELTYYRVVLSSVQCRVKETGRLKAKYLQTVNKTAEANKVLAGAVEIDYQLNLAFINVS